mmetsp:Transcript_21147/g.47947  ORF Transcript_21147/g.47947 Transcript_21147/m.47947 type:complete len:81 (+) Transcript_21147:1212-1454(+)|eukprot:CAMPEP_0113312702 /NCGR_PEP_ID=MMETSP0010_2-20120614/9431_1 /TAXON_ID=216773 ORGANISM="Corethron hystrix, Strain 308" /NCGR_SAMPLE_ID=MMETSP0010_2 /ASSEMBLY_ACC=CAM_ASM_000155 /LENGTH=80 /DNA_ID=CAMNT_0000168589 /DNA_START=304 /DNA_END=546 /DNA_ORIENTATION=+ /assembly_acc=CAM_ASM_000155
MSDFDAEETIVARRRGDVFLQLEKRTRDGDNGGPSGCCDAWKKAGNILRRAWTREELGKTKDMVVAANNARESEGSDFMK